MTPEREMEIRASVALTRYDRREPGDSPGEQIRDTLAALDAEREKVARLERERDEARDEVQRMLATASAEVGDDRGMETESPVDAIRAVVSSVVDERNEARAQLAALRAEVSEAFGLPTGIGPAPGEIARLVREHREMVMRCGEAADYMAADDERIARLEAQLAALREATIGAVRCSCSLPADECEAMRALRPCLTTSAPAVEAYTRRVQAEALESAADNVCDHEQLAEGRTLAAERSSLQRWLRARAAEIRGGR